MIDFESKTGPTPYGGVKSEIYYLDNQGNPIDKSKATTAIIRELDSKGNLIQETRAKMN